MWPLLMVLVFWGIKEAITLLIKYDGFLINGEATNAPLYHMVLWSDLIFFFFFFNIHQENKKLKKTTTFVFLFSLILTVILYIFLDIDLMFFNGWSPLFAKPAIIAMCTIYFFHLLSVKKGYPYMVIGIFMYASCSLIDMSVHPFYEGVDPSIYGLRDAINLIPLIIMNILFTYEAYLIYRKLNHRSWSQSNQIE